MSYRDLQQLTERIAAGLQPLTREWDPLPVGVYSPNDYRVLAVGLGIMRAGGVIVPLHARNSVAVNADVIGRTEARCVFYHSSVAADVKALRGVSPSVESWVCLDNGGDDGPSLDRL